MDNGFFEIGPLKHLVIVGAPFFAADIEELCSEQSVKLYFLTSSDQASALEKPPENMLVTDSLKDAEVERFLDYKGAEPHEVLALSFGARWIIKAAEREKLFAGNLINAHGTRLPMDRGGGGFSWRIMRGDRIGNLLLHMIDDGVDTGPIVQTEEYIIPAHLRTPEEITADYRSRLRRFILGFLGEVIAGKKACPLKIQPEYLSAYYPRLLTNKHGFIDWSWPPHELERFILAFDDPYNGASSFWNEQRVHIKSAQLHVGEAGAHPYQSGLVIRNNGRWLVVALQGQYSLIIEQVLDESGANIIDRIKLGDRLYTPSSVLDDARAERVVIGPKGAQ